MSASIPVSRPRLTLVLAVIVYPLITAILYVLAPLTQDWLIWQRTLVVAPLMVIAMVWGVIPAVHRFAGRLIRVRL